jgi:hypothetical protein
MKMLLKNGNWIDELDTKHDQAIHRYTGKAAIAVEGYLESQ